MNGTKRRVAPNGKALVSKTSGSNPLEVRVLYPPPVGSPCDEHGAGRVYYPSLNPPASAQKVNKIEENAMLTMLDLERFPIEGDDEVKNEEREEREEPEKYAEFILKRLGLTWEELKGRKVLDVGAGEAEFVKIAQEHGVDAVAFDFDPFHVIKDRHYGVDNRPPKWWKKVNYVRGIADALPFADESFNFVVSHAAPPTIGTVEGKKGREQIKIVIQEVKRVLKKGGEFRFGPVGAMAHVFEASELFSEAEEERFSTEERIQRVQEKSMEFFKSIDPGIEEHKKDEESFYSLIKLIK